MINIKADFQNELKKHSVDTKYLIVKPNWVSNVKGEYTEPEILDWLFESFSKQEKIVIESYTPWRGLKFVENDTHKSQGVTLQGGKKHWNFYKKQDKHFLKKTGNDRVLSKHKAKYINVTNEVWNNNCVNAYEIEKLVDSQIEWKELFSYIPQVIFDTRDDATLVSLSKIKVEESIPVIFVSMSIKNLFGLIPHPSRWIPFHGENHSPVPQVIKDVYTIYNSIFDKTLWITEGIKTLVRNYCEPTQKIVKNKNIFFVGNNAVRVDSFGCKALGIAPNSVPHLQILQI
jgi:hypothetical protein